MQQFYAATAIGGSNPQRRDGRHPIGEMQLGPVRFRVDPKPSPRSDRSPIGSSSAKPDSNSRMAATLAFRNSTPPSPTIPFKARAL
jgi:hypothetical protein